MLGFNVNDLFLNETQEHIDIAEKTFKSIAEEFKAAVDLCVTAIQGGGKLLFLGNGGSAADAQHLATELTVRYVKDRPPIPAIALTTDSSCITAIGNDYSFEDIFARQVTALGRPPDVMIAISTSGKSPNVIKAINAGRQAGLKVIGLTGQDGGSMHELCDVIFKIPSKTTSRIQEMHITIGHMLCAAIEQKLELV